MDRGQTRVGDAKPWARREPTDRCVFFVRLHIVLPTCAVLFSPLSLPQLFALFVSLLAMESALVFPRLGIVFPRCLVVAIAHLYTLRPWCAIVASNGVS